ncbi:MAG: SDR family oxidoreductase [Polynucleobacter sp.]|nr:SDR family oxidoreductase [Polynucleobacter sp.]
MFNKSNKLPLSGKTSLVTGASGVIGEAITETLANLGSDLILTDFSMDKLNLLKEKINAFNIKIILLQADLEKIQSRQLLIDSLIDKQIKLDILVNNAAFTGDSHLTGWIGKLNEQSVETWSRALEVNLTSVFHLIKGLEFNFNNDVNHPASIINMASIYGFKAPVWSLYEGLKEMGNPAAYAVSKAGLIQLTKWLAVTLGPGIRVNSISPGGLYRGQSDVFINRYENKVPLMRMATVDDVCGAITYLASDLSKYVTGQNITVDGGFTL